VEKRGDCAAKVTLAITNTGSVAGAEVAQVYIHHSSSSVPKPEVELAGFKKVYLEPGESKTISIAIDVSLLLDCSLSTSDRQGNQAIRRDRAKQQHKAFSYYNVTRSCWVAEKGAYEFRVGPSSTVVSAAKGFVLEKSFRWVGQGEPVPL